MKLKNYYWLFVALFVFAFSSCNEELAEIELGVDESVFEEEVPELRYGGDGEYDVLGFGCDVAMNMYYGKNPVIDNESLKEVYKNDIARHAITPDIGNYGKTNYIAGSSSVNFLKSISQTKNISVKGSFRAISCNGSISTYYNDSSSLSSQYSFVNFERTIQKRAYTYCLGIEELRRNFLSSHFKNIIDNNFNPQTIINSYGTHVYSNVKIGGKLSLLYKTSINESYAQTESSKTRAASVGISTTVGKVFGLTMDASLNISETERQSVRNNTSVAQYVIDSKGGDSNLPFIKNVYDALSTNHTFPTAEWEQSVLNGQHVSVMIDFEPGSLIPIWEFVEDPTKREMLKTAVENYIISKELTSIASYKKIPIYRFYNPNNGEHYYTVSYRYIDGYRYENIEFYAYNPSSHPNNAIPIYRFYNTRSGDHYYTTWYRNVNGYRFENIEFYAFPNAQSAPGGVPIYRYYNGRKGHNYYSPYLRSMGDFVYENIEFYAFTAQ